MDNQDLNAEVQNNTPSVENFESAKPEDVEDKGATLDEPGDTIKMEAEKEEATQECKMEETQECKLDGETQDECKLQQENQEQNDSEADGQSEKCAETCPICGKEECECGGDATDVQECKNAAEDATQEQEAAHEDDDEHDDDEDPANDTEDECKNCKFEEGTDDDHSADGQPGNSEEDYAALLSKYNETVATLETCQEALAAQEEKYAAQEKEFAKVKEDCDKYLELTKTYEVELEELRKAVFVMVSEKRVDQAKELMSQNGLTQEQRADFLTKCQKGEYNESFETLKRDVALAYFDYNNGTSGKRNSDDDFSVSLTPSKAPVASAPKTRAQKLAEYVHGN